MNQMMALAQVFDVQLLVEEGSYLDASCLPRSSGLLAGRDGTRLRRTVERLIELHSDHRSALDYLAGLVFPQVRAAMQAFYSEEGPPMVATTSTVMLRRLDESLERAIAALCLALTEVSRQRAGESPDRQWSSACRVLALDPFWFG